MQYGKGIDMFPGVCSAFRRLAKLLLGATNTILLFILFGCTPSGESYLRHGIGSNLSAADIRTSTQALDQYFALLCSQAGFSSAVDVSSGCRMPAVDERAWTVVVLQGMNDIDRRCDAYLEWLDDKKRSQAPLLSQVNDMRSATTAIMAITNPNSAGAISIVGQAFGLLSRSIENYHSRLLLEVESSTVNSVVIQERFRFRRETQAFTYSNRPAAEYALRSYLRICLPFAIESQINDLSTLGARRELQRSDNSIFQSPATTPVFGVEELRASAPVTTRVYTRRPEPDTGWATASAIRIDMATAKAIQKAICLTGNDVDGKFGVRTQAGLKIFESVSSTTSFRDRDWRNRTIELTQPEVNELKSECAPSAKNYVESRLLTTNAALGEQLSKVIREKSAVTDTSLRFPSLRSQIAKLRDDMQLDDGPGNMFEDQITPDLFSALLAPQD
ncbi:hypothetical protein [Rhizobium leguminosarum]|uniref:hypothetical protein n=1 Tax=Rhizobium leguminosarum TaxID=384 RepID=UPI003F9BCF40